MFVRVSTRPGEANRVCTSVHQFFLLNMSLFLDFAVELAPDVRPLLSAWCALDPILAVATSDNRVGFFREEVRSPRPKRNGVRAQRARDAYAQGETIHGREVVKSCNATALAWHPTMKILAIGWQNGTSQRWARATGGCDTLSA